MGLCSKYGHPLPGLQNRRRVEEVLFRQREIVEGEEEEGAPSGEGGRGNLKESGGSAEGLRLLLCRRGRKIDDLLDGD